ncbi:MAG: PfkB family carbohydrate kinase, partial [Spirochaetota bacterium]
KANILKLNEDEAYVLAEMFKIAGKTVSEYAESLVEKYGLEFCLVTLGGKGAFAVAKTGKRIYTPAMRVNLVDTCGAGDAFTAGFISSILAGKELKEACTFGNAIGALVSGQQGATQPISESEVEAFIKTGNIAEYDKRFVEFL